MPAKRIDAYWLTHIHELAEVKPRLSALAIEKRLGEIAAKENRYPYPSQRTIGRVLQDHKNMDERTRAAFGEFHWPQAMVAGLLPWEATEVALDTLRAHLQLHRRRPSVRLVRWHWRVSLAKPGASWIDRVPLARSLTIEESMGELSENLDLLLALSGDEFKELYPEGLPGEEKFIPLSERGEG